MAAMAAYVAWCARPFCIRPKLAFSDKVPENARTEIREWFKHSALTRPKPFSWKDFRHNLKYPRSVRRGTVGAHTEIPYLETVTVAFCSGEIWAFNVGLAEFHREGDRWVEQ